jgi:hypothetical protein
LRHEPTIEFTNLQLAQVLQNLRATFGGAPTEGEREVLAQIQGSANQPRAVRDRILNRALKVAEEMEAEARARAQGIRGGTYYQPQTQQPAPQQLPQAPPQQAPAPERTMQEQPQSYPDGTIIRNPQTGQRLILRGGQWHPL